MTYLQPRIPITETIVMEKQTDAHTLAREKMVFLLSLPWMKIFSWGVFLLIVYIMRSFFTVIFLTFIISYLACNIVGFFCRVVAKWEWFRKIVVVVTFALFLLVAYMGGKFIIPNIVEQGEGVLEMVRKVGLNQNFTTFIPDAYAKWKYDMYKGSDEYNEELKGRIEKEPDLTTTGMKEFQRNAQKLRDEFKEKQVQKKGDALFEEFQKTPKYAEEYNAWLDERVTKNTFEPRKVELIQEYEQEQLRKLELEEFEALKKGFETNYEGGYEEYVKTKIVKNLMNGLTPEQQLAYRKDYKDQWVHEKGEQSVADAISTPEWEEKFHAYYEEGTHKYPYEQFLKLEQAQTEEQFIELAGKEDAEEQGQMAIEGQLKEEKLEEYSKEIKTRLSDMGIYKSVNKVADTVLPRVFTWFRGAIASALSFGFDLILSVFLSFVIVWDLPQIRSGLQSLSKSRLRKPYKELVPGLLSFGSLLGRTFQARIGIAIVNVALMLVAMLFTPIEKKVFLATIVFLGSFIPVVGVIISAVPILIVSLQVGGFFLALKMAGVITGVTIFESLVLDPKIMGEALNLHALLVLIVLTLGGHFFGIWGMLLCVPVAVYIIRYMIIGRVQGVPYEKSSAAFAGAEGGGGGGPPELTSGKQKHTQKEISAPH